MTSLQKKVWMAGTFTTYRGIAIGAAIKMANITSLINL